VPICRRTCRHKFKHTLRSTYFRRVLKSIYVQTKISGKFAQNIMCFIMQARWSGHIRIYQNILTENYFLILSPKSAYLRSNIKFFLSCITTTLNLTKSSPLQNTRFFSSGTLHGPINCCIKNYSMSLRYCGLNV